MSKPREVLFLVYPYQNAAGQTPNTPTIQVTIDGRNVASFPYNETGRAQLMVWSVPVLTWAEALLAQWIDAQ